MPVTDADMTAAVSEFQSGDTTYRLSPLADKDWGEFERWVQDKHMDLARRNMEGMKPEDRKVLIEAAYKQAASITISSPEALSIMSTVDGAAYLLYISLRREMPEIDFQAALELCTDPAAMIDFNERIAALNSQDNSDEVKEDTAPLEVSQEK
jgi:hypothetical protein